jgi:hypothetical protein
MVNFFKIPLVFLISFFICSHLYAKVMVNKKFSGDSCYRLNSLVFTQNGYIQLKIDTTIDDSVCRNIKNNINYIKAFRDNTPEQLIRNVRGISSKKQERYIYIDVLPETKYIVIDGVNYNGKSDNVRMNISNYIANLKRIKKNSNWLNNLNSSEEKLVEKKNSDKSPPKIIIFNLKNNQKLDTYNLYVRGKVTDNQGVLSVFVNGKKSGVKSDGTFAYKVKLGLGKNTIKIQAEDINNNLSEKNLNIIREEFISEQTLADVDLPTQTKMNNPNALGVVIGVENYQYVPDATYAYNDAEVFREYLSETLGFKKQRIKIATNSKATQAELSKLLGSNGWLSRNIVKSKSDVVVYFSGHGIANSKDNTTGILPFDVDPNYAIGLPLKELYYNLSKIGAKSVTVYLDACFTGQTRDSKMLIADARPIIITPNKDSIPSNITVFSASSGSQISGALREKEHGLFTYYLLKGMSGDADINKDKSIQINELSSYVSKNVKDQAAINGREQTPELQGDKDRVLVQFN